MSALVDVIPPAARKQHALVGSGVRDWQVIARIYGWRQPNGDNVVVVSPSLRTHLLCREAHLVELRS